MSDGIPIIKAATQLFRGLKAHLLGVTVKRRLNAFCHDSEARAVL